MAETPTNGVPPNSCVASEPAAPPPASPPHECPHQVHLACYERLGSPLRAAPWNGNPNDKLTACCYCGGALVLIAVAIRPVLGLRCSQGVLPVVPAAK